MGLFDFITDAFTSDDEIKGFRAADAEATAERRRGKEAARTEFDTGLERSTAAIQPDIGAGDSARAELLAALGLSGAEAQQQFVDNVPLFQAEVDAGIEAANRGFAAAGQTASGAQLKGLAEFGQRFKRSSFQDRLDRLASLSQLGSQARTNLANLEFTTAGQKADVEFGTAQQNAAQRINLENVVQEARQAPFKNLVELGKVGAQIGKAAAGAF